MSWSRRTALAALAAAAGCGFRPVYGPGGAAEGLSGQILVDPPLEPTGYLFVRAMEGRLGLPQAPVYRLAVDIDLAEEGFGITPSRDTTRFRITGSATYRLEGLGDGVQVTSGTVASFTSYAAPVIGADRVTNAGDPVTVRAARQDAVERLMTILADQTVARLLATAPTWRR